jgi:DNA-binding response OmpR family regulator
MDKKQTKQPIILIVDDKSENLQYLNNILKDNYNVRATLDGNMALEFIKTNTPDLILLDIKMPNIDGYNVCKEIKKKPNLKDTPVIFISALDDIEHKVKAFENGGVDYITKPFEPKEVLARVQNQLEIYNSKKTISQLLHQQDIFIKKIMHEINTPLSIISLNSDSIERKIGEIEEINAIKASSKTLSSIYADLSYLVKKESPQYIQKEFEILKFLSTRIMFFDELATVKNIHIQLEIDNNFNLFINEYEFERIVDNTISNAIKYSNEDSIITLQTSYENEKYLLKIIDTGIGIENIDTIFTPFFQQSSQNFGFGLGLTIVKEICDKYDIKIEIESKKGIGSVFCYDLSTIIKENK